MSEYLSDRDFTDTRAMKVEYISYFLGNHGNDCCFHERANTRHGRAPRGRPTVNPSFFSAIRIIVIAVIANISGERGGNEGSLKNYLCAAAPCNRVFIVPFLFFNHRGAETVAAPTAVVRVRIATQDLDCNGSFITRPRLGPGRPGNITGMIFPWPSGALSRRFHAAAVGPAVSATPFLSPRRYEHSSSLHLFIVALTWTPSRHPSLLVESVKAGSHKTGSVI